MFAARWGPDGKEEAGPEVLIWALDGPHETHWIPRISWTPVHTNAPRMEKEKMAAGVPEGNGCDKVLRRSSVPIPLITPPLSIS